MVMVVVQNNDDHNNCPVNKGSTFQSADKVIQCVTGFFTARFNTATLAFWVLTAAVVAQCLLDIGRLVGIFSAMQILLNRDMRNCV